MAADHPTPPDRTAPLLVGRERERTVMRQHLDAALTGRGGLALIGGEAGIGKTALAEAICREAAERGALVLTGRCYDLAETPPYGPWLELFGRYRPASGDAAPPRRLRPARHGRRGRQPDGALPCRSQDFFDGGRGAAARSCSFSMTSTGRTPPASTCSASSPASRRHAAAPAHRHLSRGRTDAPPSRSTPSCPRSSARRMRLRLDLKPLDRDAVRAVVAARYRSAGRGDGAARRLSARAGGGQSLLPRRTAPHARRGGRAARRRGWLVAGDLTRARVPALLRQVIDGRLARLGDGGAAALLAVAAVIGQEVRFDLWAAVVGDDEEALLAAMEQATEARLVEATPGGPAVRFVHALIRETLYEGMPPLRGGGCTGRSPRRSPRCRSPDPDAVAYHFQQAGDARAAEWLIQAGERAQRACAWLMAAERYRGGTCRFWSEAGGHAHARLAALPAGTPAPLFRSAAGHRAIWMRRHASPSRRAIRRSPP